ncbi:MAG TPA: hypothetical protein DEH25_17780 [Chloroflexi bacterium]|nr:hypothetical protein [Chloroflexota bacterium]HBY09134.1 hypothetical protein [Chloroflexota bacterium]
MTTLPTPVSNPQCQKLVERLNESALKTQEFFQSIEGDQWYVQVYTEGANWSVFQILGHFVVTEASIARLIKYILQGLPGVPEDFDMDKFNEREVNCFSKLPIEMVLQRFGERRAETIELIFQMDDADLAKQGRHPWLGVAPVEDMLKLLYRHNQIHQRDIRKVLAS